VEAIRHLALPVSSKKKTPKETVIQTILAICNERPCTLGELANLLQRSTSVIRKDYVQPMLKDRLLHYKYPTKPNHPEQAYRSNHEEAEK